MNSHDLRESDLKSAPPPPSGSPDRDLIDRARRAARGSGSASSTWAPIPPDSIPGYEIVREIHRGGQGVVYQSIQKTTKRKVAVKVMKESPISGSRGRARFDREVEILAQLNHPNIVSIIDSGEHAGCFYYVMDYISGHSLDTFMSGVDRSIDETLRLFARICEVVNVAHLKGVIHRDLKPGNIRIDSSGEPHVLDFGLAKTATGEVADTSQLQLVTMTGQFIGSLPWASPEQAEGAPDKVDVRTDVYSLGVVLYQMLTGGKFPYRVVGNMRDILDNILTAEPARPSTIRRQVNDEVETIVLKCLTKERERRYQSAGELARDVRRYLDGEPIEAKRDSAWYVLKKSIRRHRVPAGIAAAFLFLIIGFGVAMTALYARAASAERDAVVNLGHAEQARDAEAVQRSRAQHNFDSARSLAHAMLFDFHDAIEPLRGATKARRLLLDNAREYLQSVRAEAGDDPAFLRELADANDKTGDLFAGLYEARLGVLAEAVGHWTEARTIREGLLQQRPEESRSHADMARSHLRSGWERHLSRRFAEAREAHTRAIAACDEALRRAGGDEAREIEDLRSEAILRRADAIVRLAVDSADDSQTDALLAQALADYVAVRDFWSARVTSDPANDKAARALGLCEDKRASALITIGQEARRAAVSAARAAGADAPTPDSIQRALAFFEQARDLTTASADEFRRLSALVPESRRYRRDLYLALHNRGLARTEIGLTLDLRAAADRPPDHDEVIRAAHAAALEDYSAALGVTDTLASSDESDIEAQRDLAICLNKVGNELRRLGRLDESAAAFDRSLAVRDDLFQSEGTPRHQQDLARALAKAGEITDRLARALPEDEANAPERRALLLAAAERYEQSLANFNELAQAGAMDEDAREVEQVRAALNRVRARLEPLGAGP